MPPHSPATRPMPFLSSSRLAFAWFLGISATLPVPAPAFTGRPALEVIEQLSRAAGRAPARGAAEALERALVREGDAALEMARRGGLGLPEAAARHGDEVFRYAVRVPEAAPALAARADELLPLARAHGEDLLRLEARVPGLGGDAARLFPQGDALRRLSRLPPDQARDIISYAHHATDAEAPLLLLRAVERGGGAVLRRLDPKTILALGLSSAMVIGSAGGAVAIGSSPESFIAMLRSLSLPVAGSLGLVILAIGLVLAAALAWRLGLGRRSSPQRVARGPFPDRRE